MEEILQTLGQYKTANYISYAIPFFFLFIFVELGISVYKKFRAYRLNDSLNDLTLGIYQQLIGISYRVFLVFAYILLFEYFRIYTTPVDAIWAWVLSFLAVDFCYYWFHRTSHQVALVWGSHEPHHSSEEYNLTVALRQGAFQGIFSMPFYFPLAILGVHPVIFLVCSQFNTIYQFWIHTRLIDKMPAWFEAVFNTPSHHRVHHGRNPKYIDKNHAGTLIIWDKLFGTFQAEEEEPVYGTVKPLANFNPFWANIQYWLGLVRLSKKTRGIKNKLAIWFMPPGYKPPDLGPMSEVPEVDAQTYIKYDPAISQLMSRYVLLNFVLILPVTLMVIFMGTKAISWGGLILVGCALFSLMSIGFLMEGRKVSATIESIRLALVTAVLALWGASTGSSFTFSMPVLAVGVSMLLWFELKVKHSLPLLDPARLSLSKEGRYPFLAFGRNP